MPRYEVYLSAHMLIWCDITVDADDEDAARQMALEEASAQSHYDWEDSGNIEDVEVDSVDLVEDDDGDE